MIGSKKSLVHVLNQNTCLIHKLSAALLTNLLLTIFYGGTRHDRSSGKQVHNV